MATKKQPVKTLRKYASVTKRKTGHVAQTIRLTVGDNQIIHKAAALDGWSFNGWAVMKLLEEAGRIIEKDKAKAAKKAGE